MERLVDERVDEGVFRLLRGSGPRNYEMLVFSKIFGDFVLKKGLG